MDLLHNRGFVCDLCHKYCGMTRAKADNFVLSFPSHWVEHKNSKIIAVCFCFDRMIISNLNYLQIITQISSVHQATVHIFCTYKNLIQKLNGFHTQNFFHQYKLTKTKSGILVKTDMQFSITKLLSLMAASILSMNLLIEMYKSVLTASKNRQGLLSRMCPWWRRGVEMWTLDVELPPNHWRVCRWNCFQQRLSAILTMKKECRQFWTSPLKQSMHCRKAYRSCCSAILPRCLMNAAVA